MSIIRLEGETEWSLEVVNYKNTSIVWDDLFTSDEQAYAEFERTVAEEGMRTFLDQGDILPLSRVIARRNSRPGESFRGTTCSRLDCLPEGFVRRRAPFLSPAEGFQPSI